MSQRFNPFEDRLSRDIRNDLSASLPTVLESHSLQAAQAIADTYLQENPAAHYRDYIDRRLAAYRSALQSLPSSGPSSALITAAVLWDLGLFFEVHEVLELHWLRATGERKLLLQALIRAAGVYVYLEAGYPERSAKIAGKALPVLRRLQTLAAAHLNIEELIIALETPIDPIPPHLRRK
ncbi:MAG: DUF309 domain-containing protein [Desulfofustis sp.]|nr:DUF309 domain-containing protein [Desulfofustis sp.]